MRVLSSMVIISNIFGKAVCWRIGLCLFYVTLHGGGHLIHKSQGESDRRVLFYMEYQCFQTLRYFEQSEILRKALGKVSLGSIQLRRVMEILGPSLCFFELYP